MQPSALILHQTQCIAAVLCTKHSMEVLRSAATCIPVYEVRRISRRKRMVWRLNRLIRRWFILFFQSTHSFLYLFGGSSSPFVLSSCHLEGTGFTAQPRSFWHAATAKFRSHPRVSGHAFRIVLPRASPPAHQPSLTDQRAMTATPSVSFIP